MKGRTCADGSTQRKYVPWEEASSPTLPFEALMGILLLNAYEQCDTVIFDVPGAYLHAEMPDNKFAILKIEGEFVNIMCEVNPEYKDDVRYENGKKVFTFRFSGHYTELLNLHYSGTICTQKFFTRKDSKLMCMTDVLPTSLLMANNVPLLGTLTTISCHMLRHPSSTA